jgi:hypothetical protein
MRARRSSLVLFVLLLAAPVLAGDGDKPAAPPKEQPAKPAAETSGKAEKPAAQAPAPLARPAPKSLDEALRRLAAVRVSANFKETSLTDAVDWLRRVAGFNVMVSPVLSAKGLDGMRPLTMTVTDVSMKQLAELVAQLSGTKMKFADGILQFTTPEDARGKPVLRIIAIGDLTMPLRNFPGPELDLRPAHSEFVPEPESDVESAWSDPQKVIELIQKMCSPETWSDKDVSISADQHKLVVRQYPEVHKEIVRLVAMLRGAR